MGTTAKSFAGANRVLLLPDGETCPCEDFQLQRKPCEHIHAARFVREPGLRTPE